MNAVKTDRLQFESFLISSISIQYWKLPWAILSKLVADKTNVANLPLLADLFKLLTFNLNY